VRTSVTTLADSTRNVDASKNQAALLCAALNTNTSLATTKQRHVGQGPTRPTWRHTPGSSPL
jgi:hypothetical protein